MTSKLKKKKQPAPVKKEEIRTDPSVGIVGWNLPKFMAQHEAFIAEIKNGVLAAGGQSVFYGISGGADVLPGFAGNGHRDSHGEIIRKDTDSNFKPNYWLPSRDMVADQIEVLVHQENLSALVFVPWSVSSLVGMMMATARTGIPAIFLPHYRTWPILSSLETTSVAYSHCSILLLLEIFGITKLGVLETIFSNDDKKTAQVFALGQGSEIDLASWGGRRIVEMAKQSISSKRFFSQAAFSNALALDMALGNSAETVLHLRALAAESGVPFTPAIINEAAKRMPQLVPMDSDGEYSMESFRNNGGILPLLGALYAHLQASPTVMGRNLIEFARDAAGVKSTFKIAKPARGHGGLAILYGNLAAEGAVFRTAGLKDHWLAACGAAKVFNSEAECVAAILGKKVKKGDVIVLRYCGPKGGPGMPSLDAVPHALEERGLEDHVAILTDGRISASGRTPAFVHAAPEAAVGSALSVLQDGDVIFWNFNERALTVRLTDTDIKVRLSRWREQEKNMRNSFLFRYSKYSSSSSSGATLV